MNQYVEDLCRSDWEHLIYEWVFDERGRKMLERKLLDGLTYSEIAEEFHMSDEGTRKIIRKCRNQLFKHI